MWSGQMVLMMEAAGTSETSVNFYQTTRRNTPEDSPPWEPEISPAHLLNLLRPKQVKNQSPNDKAAELDKVGTFQ
jgi:hypothetical protein